MNYLIIGQGGREHALVKSLVGSPVVNKVHVIPGNSGMSLDAHCHNLNWKNFSEISSFCEQNKIDVVIIGPEDPLVNGLSDYLREKELLVVGPSMKAAQLEGSKILAKEFMLEFGISTAKATSVNSVESTLEAAKNFTPPYVLKADGLAGGKGVILCKDLKELEDAAQSFFNEKIFGNASSKALLEQYLMGYEISLLLATNGSEFQLMPLAQDHKALNDGDEGPNTGGMGTFAPMKISDSLYKEIELNIIKPTLLGLKKRNMTYRGIIFLGLMVTQDGPKLLEYNCRWGDPETQVILPLLDGDWGSVFSQWAKGEISSLKWKNIYSTCVVMAAPGYPQKPLKGVSILGDISKQTNNAYYIHSGTQLTSNGTWETQGGRVLCAIGIGKNKEESRINAYDQAKVVTWEGLQMRTDIGLRPSNPQIE